MFEFKTLTGTIRIDDGLCCDCPDKPCVAACDPQVLTLRAGRPALAIPVEKAARGGCPECLACELVCSASGQGAITIILPIPGLEEVTR